MESYINKHIIGYSYGSYKYIAKRELRGVTPKSLLAIIAISAAIVFVIWLILRKRGKKTCIPKLVNLFFFITYVGVVLLITIISRDFGSKQNIVHLDLLAFTYFDRSRMIYLSAFLVLNILLFVPFGFLCRLFFYEKKYLVAPVIVTLISFAFSLGVESMQLLTGTGMFEVDDLLMNTIGGFFGAILGTLVLMVRRKNVQTFTN